ncbi:cobalt transporter CbiM [Desulfotomaculum copahuensis]|uniref:Cobalamin biosynthesis protein CbiM n=1 Tax=Desulfotomaculum copahuensis TaxID=1838280 RepID=A0A1B7LHJ4_9FIRM|nr:cobalt transporter CbiM [Desulfotomaculum copahuensis]OAT85755.1 cobalamin biosynthesis protein CbiM [Desulfotomaculum copahuensis]
MHIPDGYLSPQTCAVMGAAMLPVWATAVKKVKQTLKTRYVPLMAIGAAFSFVIMMYNVPIPDGTTAHAVGGALLAVILGPWAASISITVALAIQALLFGDGGILAFGANAFNMVFVLPFSAYYIYRLIAGRSEVSSARRWIGGLAGGYIGIVLAAVCAGTEFGLQPLLFHAANGSALYCPYPLSMALPAMALAHLAVAGPIEGVITALVIRYLQVNNPALLSIESVQAPVESRGYKKLWWGLAILVLFTPLGLLALGTAWGEWGVGELKDKLGYIPAGMQQMADRWHALMPDYGLPGFDHSFLQSATGYILAAVVGVAVIAGITYLFSRAQKNAGRDVFPPDKKAKGTEIK